MTALETSGFTLRPSFLISENTEPVETTVDYRDKLQGIVVQDHLEEAAILLETILARQKNKDQVDISRAFQSMVISDISLEQIETNPDFFHDLSDEYQLAFADGRQWGECCVCSACSSVISSQTLNDIAIGATAGCCESPSFSLFHPKNKIEDGIKADFNLKGAKPFLKVATGDLGDGKLSVFGFMWGCSNGLEGLADHMIEKYYHAELTGGKVTDEFIGSRARQIKEQLAMASDVGQNWVQVSEMAVREEVRAMSLVMMKVLYRECVDQPDNTRYMCWTSEKSRVLGPMVSLGAQKAVDLGGGDLVLTGSVDQLEENLYSLLTRIDARTKRAQNIDPRRIETTI